MDSINWWEKGVSVLAWVVAGGLALLYRWLMSKMNTMEKDVSDLDKKVTEGFHLITDKLNQSNLEILQNKLDTQKTYVEKAEYIAAMDKFDRKLEKVSDDLGQKIDHMAQNVTELLKTK